MRVAFLGAGTMGEPMAANLVRAGHEVTLWNRTRERAEAVEGAVVAGSPAEAATRAEILVTMLRDGPAVDGTVRDALSRLRGGVWAQMSTVGVDWTERLAAAAAEHGVGYVDAPVLGTRAPAEAGALTVLAGGEAAAIDRAAPLFEAVGQRTVRVGGVGSATRLKLVVNVYIVLLMEAIAEPVALARSLGLDPRAFLETIDGVPFGSAYAQTKGGMMVAGEFEPASFALELALKDARLALAEGGLQLPGLEAVARQLERAVEAGHGREDMAAVARALDGG